MSHALIEFLRSNTVEAIVGKQKIHCCRESDSVSAVYHKLKLHNILSVPLVNSSGKVTGFVDILDLVECACTGDWQQISLVDLANASGRNPYVTINLHDSLLEILRLMCFTHGSLHRLAVVNEGKLVAVLSQSEVVRFLSRHVSEFDFGNLPIAQHHLGIRNVFTVNESSTTLDALKLIRDNKVSGLAIVNDSGKMTGVFSATDLKSFGFGVSLDNLRSTTMQDFIATKTQQIYCVTATTTTDKVVKLASSRGVHRIFVVDDRNRPIGVISLGDIIFLFFRHIMIE